MRQVSYFFGGHLADFPIPDDFYQAFAERATNVPARPGPDLEKARLCLEKVLSVIADEGQPGTQGQDEMMAAAYIWFFFNNADPESAIEGDVIVVDYEGDGQDIAYVPLADVDLVPED